MQYIVISRDGVVITKSTSSYFLGRSIKNYLSINKLKDSKLYYFSKEELGRFIKKGGSDKYINVRKERIGKNHFVALSKTRGKRLFQGSSVDLAIDICKYVKKRKLLKEINYKDVEECIKNSKNVLDFEILKFGIKSKDAEKFMSLEGMSNIKTNAIAYELNTML